MKKYLNTPEEVIQVLKNGKEVRLEEGGAGAVKLIDGFCVKQWQDQFNINYTINLRDKPYIEEAEPLKFEVGKFYKSRAGEKWLCVFIASEKLTYPIKLISPKNGENLLITFEGRYAMTGELNPDDIIGEWEEE